MTEFGDAETESHRDELIIRENALLELHTARWLRHVPAKNPSYSPHRVRFRRGFPEYGSFHIDYLRMAAEAIFAHPLLRASECLRSTTTISVNCSGCRGLRISWQVAWNLTPLQGTGLPPPEWSLLADCPNLSNLDSLALAFGGVLTPNGAEQIGKNVALADVSTLCIKEEEGSLYAIPLLLAGEAFRSLSRLEIVNFRGGYPPIPNLGVNPRLARLEDLRLGGYTASAENITQFLGGNSWASLRNFDFSYGVLGERATTALAASQPAALRSLALMNYAFLSGEALCGPVLWGLRSLDLSGNDHVGSEVVRYLANCSEAVGLWNLSLAGCGRVGDQTVFLLADSPAFFQLRWLDLHNTAITRDGAKALAASPYLRNLGLLKVHGCKIGPYAQEVLHGRFGDHVRW